MIVFSTSRFFFLRFARRRRSLSAYIFDGNGELGFASKQCDENEKGVYPLSAIKAQEMPQAPV